MFKVHGLPHVWKNLQHCRQHWKSKDLDKLKKYITISQLKSRKAGAKYCTEMYEN